MSEVPGYRPLEAKTNVKTVENKPRASEQQHRSKAREKHWFARTAGKSAGVGIRAAAEYITTGKAKNPLTGERIGKPRYEHQEKQRVRPVEAQYRPKAREKHTERRRFVAPAPMAVRREAQEQRRLANVRSELKRQVTWADLQASFEHSKQKWASAPHSKEGSSELLRAATAHKEFK